MWQAQPTGCLRHAKKFGARASRGRIRAALPRSGRFGILQGQVTDPSGAAVPTATVNLRGTGGTVRATATDGQGRYRVNNLVPGAYSSASPARGLRRSRRPSPSQITALKRLDVQLKIQQQSEKVTVSATASALSVDASQNAGQLVLRGGDLDAFSDDPEDLANELQMLAGPAAGPNGGQIFIDDFSCLFPACTMAHAVQCRAAVVLWHLA